MHQDIVQQPEALRRLVAFYTHDEGAAYLQQLPAGAPLLTGMGASLHAAQAIAPAFLQLGIPATVIEATELLYYGRALLQPQTPLIFISQSGKSPEIAAVHTAMPAAQTLLAVTNTPESQLAEYAQLVLPMMAGPEKGVATRSYVNSMALLWLLAQHWHGAATAQALALLGGVAEQIERLLADSTQIVDTWLGALGSAEQIVFAGHGPHAATARQAALMLAERTKVRTISTTIGAFRHGPIEITQAGIGVVIFAAPGCSYESAQALAAELQGYGASVLLIAHGRARAIDGSDAGALGASPIDEFLAPMLDVVPAQLFADALADRLGVELGFRYLGKTVKRI